MTVTRPTSHFVCSAQYVSLTPLPMTRLPFSLPFFFALTSTPEIYTLSLHDALPISAARFPPLPGVERPSRQTRSTAPRHDMRSEEHTSELQSHSDLVCRLLLEKKKKRKEARDGGNEKLRQYQTILPRQTHEAQAESV